MSWWFNSHQFRSFTWQRMWKQNVQVLRLAALEAGSGQPSHKYHVMENSCCSLLEVCFVTCCFLKPPSKRQKSSNTCAKHRKRSRRDISKNPLEPCPWPGGVWAMPISSLALSEGLTLQGGISTAQIWCGRVWDGWCFCRAQLRAGLSHLCPSRVPIRAWKGMQELCPPWRPSSTGRGLWVSQGHLPHLEQVKTKHLWETELPSARFARNHSSSGNREWCKLSLRVGGWEGITDSGHRQQKEMPLGCPGIRDVLFMPSMERENWVKFSSVLDGHFVEPEADVYHTSQVFQLPCVRFPIGFPSVPVTFCTSWSLPIPKVKLI